jgi:hypothetical protein
MINRMGRPGVRSSAQASPLYQGLPQAMSQVIAPGGTMNEIWYRFFQMMWMKTSSGISNDITLASVADTAQTALDTANNAQSDATVAQNMVQAETERAEGVETNLQGQITTNANNIASESNRWGQANNFGNTVGGSPGALQGYINFWANGINYAIQLYAP